MEILLICSQGEGRLEVQAMAWGSNGIGHNSFYVYKNLTKLGR
jgi:hypothetical protein